MYLTYLFYNAAPPSWNSNSFVTRRSNTSTRAANDWTAATDKLTNAGNRSASGCPPLYTTPSINPACFGSTAESFSLYLNRVGRNLLKYSKYAAGIDTISFLYRADDVSVAILFPPESTSGTPSLEPKAPGYKIRPETLSSVEIVSDPIVEPERTNVSNDFAIRPPDVMMATWFPPPSLAVSPSLVNNRAADKSPVIVSPDFETLPATSACTC